MWVVNGYWLLLFSGDFDPYKAAPIFYIFMRSFVWKLKKLSAADAITNFYVCEKIINILIHRYSEKTLTSRRWNNMRQFKIMRNNGLCSVRTPHPFLSSHLPPQPHSAVSTLHFIIEKFGLLYMLWKNGCKNASLREKKLIL